MILIPTRYYFPTDKYSAEQPIPLSMMCENMGRFNDLRPEFPNQLEL